MFLCSFDKNHLRYFVFVFRREYIDILNANTLSLDGMADINMALRGAISGNNWNKHGHVKWVVEQMAKLLQAITPTG